MLLLAQIKQGVLRPFYEMYELLLMNSVGWINSTIGEVSQMLKKRLFFACICLCVSLLLAESSFAEAYTQWQLPEGVLARLGKGWVTDCVFSPDGSHLVVASSIGIWIYETTTY